MLPAGGHRSGWDGHVLLAYATERERRDGLAAWVRRGLEADARVVYLEPFGGPAERSLVHVLSEDDVDVTDALRRGQLQVVDPADGFGAAWQAAVVAESLGAGYPAVRFGGEAGTSWSVLPPPAHADLEQASDELCRTRPVSMLCQYSTDVTPSIMQRACAMHSAGVREAKLQTVPSSDGVALVGEVDLSNVQIVRSAVAAACDTVDETKGTVVVDLRQLEFLDVAGARALLSGTVAHRDRGGVLRLRGARPLVDRFLRQLAVDRFDGVLLEDAS